MKLHRVLLRDGIAGRNVLRGRLGPGHRFDHRHGEGSFGSRGCRSRRSWSPVADRGITRHTVTNSAGEYNESALPAGNYDVIVTATGFKKYQAKGVVLDVAQKGARGRSPWKSAPSARKSLSKAQTVAQVETQSSELAGTVTGKEISQLELNGRNFTQLVTLVPGVSNQTGQDEGSGRCQRQRQFSMNGGRIEYNNWETRRRRQHGQRQQRAR